MQQKIITLVLVIISVGLIATVIIGSLKQSGEDPLSASLGDTTFMDEAQITTQLAGQIEQTNIYYWGTTCPFCHDVIDWLDENKVEELIPLVRKEVYENEDNALDLSLRAASCGLDQRNIGVPFLFTLEGDCLIGAPDIISYLEQSISEATRSDQEIEQEDEINL